MERKYKNLTIKVEVDIDSVSSDPRDWDNTSKMIFSHKRYNLGDKHDYKFEDYNSWKEFKADIIRREKPLIIKSVYMYDHGGITISTSRDYPYNDRWDSGQIGYVIINRKSVKLTHGWKRLTKDRLDRLNDCLEGEVKCYDHYLRGDVYGFRVLDEQGEEIDNCGGYVGEVDDCMKEGLISAKSCYNYLCNQHFETLKKWIKNKVPFHYRTPLMV